ncbi:hypothetical protein, partial [Neobacillus drentensis]|uniref:hypothetical protein n=1 Tax=Neobacillus drentensis TaxID=220684 RepID=UPI0030023474
TAFYMGLYLFPGLPVLVTGIIRIDTIRLIWRAALIMAQVSSKFEVRGMVFFLVICNYHQLSGILNFKGISGNFI